jgi:hypothetical protein
VDFVVPDAAWLIEFEKRIGSHASVLAFSLYLEQRDGFRARVPDALKPTLDVVIEMDVTYEYTAGDSPLVPALFSARRRR